jgi:condensin-2 complex subunit H2
MELTPFSMFKLPVEARITLVNNVDRDDLQRKVVRPPANLLVFEGDCLDSEASELDSYMVNFVSHLLQLQPANCDSDLVAISVLQLSTCNFFGHFLLLDPCDAPAVFDYLQGKKGNENSVAHRGSRTRSKNRTGPFTSPNRRSGSTGRRLNSEKGQGDPDPTQETTTDQSQGINPTQETTTDQSQGINENETQENINDVSLGGNDWSYDNMPPSGGAAEYPDDGDDSDEEDLWRHMDPNGPGNLKIRLYKRGTEPSFSRHTMYLFFSFLVAACVFN